MVDESEEWKQLNAELSELRTIDVRSLKEERRHDELLQRREELRSGGGESAGGGKGGGLMSALASERGSIGLPGIKKPSGSTLFIILAFLLFLFDVVTGYKGFFITDIDPLGALGAIGSFGYLVGFWALFFLVSIQG